MTRSTYFLILAVIMLALVPIAPSLLRLRIALLRKIRWRWLADLHERHFDGFVIAVRTILITLAALLIVLAWR